MYKNIWKNKIFIIIVIVFVVGMIYSYVIEPKINKYSSDKTENENSKQKKIKEYDWTDAKKEEIINLFKHIGFYYDYDKDGKDEEIWSATLKTMYDETEKIKEKNSFASNINGILLKENNSIQNKFEEDILDMYKTILFIGTNNVNSSFKKSDLVELEQLKCTKVYINNYDDNYNTQNEDAYRIIYIYIPKMKLWIRSLSTDKVVDGKYYEIYKEVELDSKADFKTVESKKVNDIIDFHEDLFDILLAYRNDIFYDYKISKMKELEEKYKVPTEYEPTIGMTKSQVLSSTWGRPTKKNVTETAYGVHEQWVYGNGKYIYFDDGVVTSIQKTNR